MQCNIVIADGSVVIAGKFAAVRFRLRPDPAATARNARHFERRFVFRGGKQSSEGVFQFVFEALLLFKIADVDELTV